MFSLCSVLCQVVGSNTLGRIKSFGTQRVLNLVHSSPKVARRCNRCNLTGRSPKKHWWTLPEMATRCHEHRSQCQQTLSPTLIFWRLLPWELASLWGLCSLREFSDLKLIYFISAVSHRATGSSRLRLLHACRAISGQMHRRAGHAARSLGTRPSAGARKMPSHCEVLKTVETLDLFLSGSFKNCVAVDPNWISPSALRKKM